MQREIMQIFRWNEIAWNRAGEINKELEKAMLLEEVNEFLEAMKNDDKIEMMDWFCDIIFVLIGTMMKAWYKDVHLQCWMDEVIDSNFTKFEKYEKLGFVCNKNEMWKIQKPKSFRKPNFDFLKNDIAEDYEKVMKEVKK